MQTPLYKEFLDRLIDLKSIQRSSISSTIRKSKEYLTLLEAEIISEERSPNGGWLCKVINEKALNNHYGVKFPVQISDTINAITNTHIFRDSKSRKRESQCIVLLRGFHEIKLNGISINIKKFTNDFGLFSTTLNSIEYKKICLVENLDSFIKAEEIFGTAYTFIHLYGRPGKTFGSKLQCEELIVFSDYDFVGLNDYINIKNGCNMATLYIPENFESLYDNNHRLKPLNQPQYKKVMESTLPEVIRVRLKLLEKGKMLEQQKLFKL